MLLDWPAGQVQTQWILSYSFFPQISINSVLSLSTPTSSCTATKLACLRLSESCLYLFLYFRNNSSQWPTSPVNCYHSILSLKHSFSPSDQHLHLYGQHHGQGPLYPDDGSPLLPEQSGEVVWGRYSLASSQAVTSSNHIILWCSGHIGWPPCSCPPAWACLSPDAGRTAWNTPSQAPSSYTKWIITTALYL